MRALRRSIILSVLICLCIATLAYCEIQKNTATKQEAVNITYELILSKCQNGKCHLESVAKDQVNIQFEAETPSFAWGYEGREVRIGDITYFFRFKAVHDSKDKNSRFMFVGFAGRLGTPDNDKQVTWGEKQVSRISWQTLPIVSVLGNTYTDGGDTVTPRIDVKILSGGSGIAK
ncbi:MAG: hypothetical protein ACLQM6_08685 [Acidobacteriaceae bacterium]